MNARWTDWDDLKDHARTPDGTKEVSDKNSTMDFPEQLTEEVHMGWNTKRRLWIENTAEFTKLLGTPMSSRLPRAPSFIVPCETGEGFETVWAFPWATQGSCCAR